MKDQSIIAFIFRQFPKADGIVLDEEGIDIHFETVNDAAYAFQQLRNHTKELMMWQAEDDPDSFSVGILRDDIEAIMMRGFYNGIN